jgi:hypothetical protein
MGHALCPLVQDENAIHILLIVGAVLDLSAKIVFHTGRGRSAVEVLVHIDAHHFIRRQETVSNPLFQAVGIHRFAKIAGIFDGRGDEQIADIDFAEFIFIDFVQNAPVCRGIGCTLSRLVYGREHMPNI